MKYLLLLHSHYVYYHLSADENKIIFDENKIKNVKDPITMELVSRYL